MIQKVTEWIHEWKIKDKRVKRLTLEISNLIDSKSTILDVGCGDGTLAKSVSEDSNASQVHGIDVLIRKDCKIPCSHFDGSIIPYPDSSFDYILLVDVLHHIDNPESLFKECIRVSRNGIIVKDHLNNSLLDYYTLRFMDRVGNARYDVHLPHNYFSSNQWEDLFSRNKLTVYKSIQRLLLYPFPFNFLFDRQLHRIWHLKKAL